MVLLSVEMVVVAKDEIALADALAVRDHFCNDRGLLPKISFVFERHGKSDIADHHRVLLGQIYAYDYAAVG